MGYLTTYNLIIENATPDEEDKIHEMLMKLDIIGYALDDNFDSYDSVMWYSYDDDMLKVSRAFPHVHFILSGEGENNDDIWEHHFLGGRSARYDAEIVIPPFNIDDLR